MSPPADASFAPVPVAETTSYQRRPPDVQASDTTDNIHLRRPNYRGNFSTSICSLFSTPHRRSDCCSIAICGVLAADRNRYLLLDKTPPPWWRRLLFWVALPLGLLVADQHVLGRMETIQISQKCHEAFPDDGSGPNLDVFNATAAAYSGDSNASGPDVSGLQTAHMVLLLSFLFVLSFLLARAAQQRFHFRNTVMSKLYEMDNNGDRSNVQANLILSRADTRIATRTCGCYRAPDELYGLEDTANDQAGDGGRGDLCTCLWNFVSTLFCRGCCGCWCQCCGMCATAQEEREIEAIVPKEKLLMDYVTFQPFAEYFPSLENLRRIGDGSFLAHWRAMSHLATMLMRSIGVILLVLGIYALTDIDSHFTLKNMVVVVATLLQSFLLLYFVHWRWHRLDLSLDAVVKYFATGFLFSTSTALIVEMLVSAAVSIVTGVVGIIAVAFEVGVGELDEDTDPKDAIKILIKDNAWLGVLFMFMNAFIVAATTEELCKYFGYWMVEHPDLLTSEDEVGMPRTDQGDEDDKEFTIGDDSAGDVEVDHSRRSLNSKGAGITIAMVCTATGFACCENLKYVFASQDITTEIGTLIARSVFPVHALAAAIQSIGVCRRDIEGDKSFQLGRIILPAVTLHGCFDFFLMVAPVLAIVSHADDIETDDDDVSKQEEARYNMYVKVCEQYGAIDEDVWQPTHDDDSANQNMPQTDAIITGTAFCLSILSVVIGTIYYIVQSQKQKGRLHALDSARSEGSTLGLV